MKFSVVITVKNEERSMNRLIDSLEKQTKKADEIIIVDAGSSDDTIVKVKNCPATTIVRTIVVPGANRSRGRNTGIKAARGEIIAVTDAGCTADSHWLERLVKPFKNKTVMSVAGYYLPVTKTYFQKCVAPFVAVMPDKFDPKIYLPSSRSLAFRRGAAWYPENLNYCEDLIFAQRLKAAGPMAVVPQALVYWRQAANLRQFFWQIFYYAQGDIQARYRPHLIRIATVFGRYLVFLVWPPLFLVYWLWPLIKHRNRLAPGLQLTADLAVMAGSLSAIISKRYDTFV